mgnify:CR=1 FL=1
MGSILAIVIAGLILYFFLRTRIGGCLLRVGVAIVIFYVLIFFLGIWFIGNYYR